MAEVIYSFPNQKDFYRMAGLEKSFAADSQTNAFIYKAFDEKIIYGIEGSSVNLGFQLAEISWEPSAEFEIHSPSREVYIQQLNKLIDQLQSDGLKKVVFSRPLIHKKSVNDISAVLSKLRAQYPKAFVYALNSDRFGFWIGVSPETLLTGQEYSFKTVSLAGTKATSVSNWTNKEIEEQAMVTDYIVNTLKHNSASDVLTSKTETVNAGPVDHLLSEISFKYANSILALVGHLSPTPAVCGLPKLAALNYIKEHENYNRSLYSSFIGLIGPDSTSLYVNLRCMQIGSNSVCLYLGGGITAQSVAENEWEETLLKSKTLLDIL